jgi:colicin import membrane protein
MADDAKTAEEAETEDASEAAATETNNTPDNQDDPETPAEDAGGDNSSDDLAKLLAHPGVQAAIQAAVDETHGKLLGKRDELLAEVKAERAAKRDAEAALADLRQRIDALEADKATLSGQLQDAQEAREAAITKAKADLAKAQADGDEKARAAALDALERATADKEAAVSSIEKAARERNDRATQRLVGLASENALLSALSGVGVKADLFGAAKAILAAKVSVDDDLNATIEGQPVAEYVSGWAQSSEGRHFVRAKLSTGGGGFTKPGSTATQRGAFADNPWKRGATFNLTRQGQIMKSDPSLAAQLKRAAGV